MMAVQTSVYWIIFKGNAIQELPTSHHRTTMFLCFVEAATYLKSILIFVIVGVLVLSPF